MSNILSMGEMSLQYIVTYEKICLQNEKRQRYRQQHLCITIKVNFKNVSGANVNAKNGTIKYFITFIVLETWYSFIEKTAVCSIDYKRSCICVCLDKVSSREQ